MAVADIHDSPLPPPDAMEVDIPSSRPPSPPSSGRATPTLRHSICPSRLRPLIPPPNFGAVKDGELYRSSFPQDRNLEFLRTLNLRTVLCLVDTPPTQPYNRWISSSRIKWHHLPLAANKDGKVTTSWDSLCSALLLVMDAANYPMYVHCNQGRHRTGCLVACLRKVQRWPLADIIAEYEAYASPKIRPGDIELITAFDPEAVHEYAKAHGYPLMKRMDSAITNVDALAAAMAANVFDEGVEEEEVEEEDINVSAPSNASTISDEGLEMAASSFREGGNVRKTELALFDMDVGAGADAPNGEHYSTAQMQRTRLPADIAPVLFTDTPTTHSVKLPDQNISPPPQSSYSFFSLDT